MLSFNAPTPPWQMSLLAAAQQRRGRRVALRGHAASEVVPRLFLTDLFTARDETHLTSLGITHVLSVIERPPLLPQTCSLQTLHIPLTDSSDEDILAHFPATTTFIRNALAESPDSRVMVHCLMGISRSATVVCAYLVATMRMTPNEALATVRAKRGIVSPNSGFLRQLEDYAAQVQGGRGRKAVQRSAKLEAIRKLTRGSQKDLGSNAALMIIPPSSRRCSSV
ncbi:protein-tyrosine phosphatase-like protein [Russula earlei]|uniref:Protein-tyrosine phosphatase-like protein n=1 Tax=Russula earlei TaxID=71964 RepID=A0ACC0UFX4_9AGAM|nr:protein-tyrosine phosphatase-like protein [Russula earlei]